MADKKNLYVMSSEKKSAESEKTQSQLFQNRYLKTGKNGQVILIFV